MKKLARAIYFMVLNKLWKFFHKLSTTSATSFRLISMTDAWERIVSVVLLETIFSFLFLGRNRRQKNIEVHHMVVAATVKNCSNNRTLFLDTVTLTAHSSINSLITAVTGKRLTQTMSSTWNRCLNELNFRWNLNFNWNLKFVFWVVIPIVCPTTTSQSQCTLSHKTL